MSCGSSWRIKPFHHQFSNVQHAPILTAERIKGKEISQEMSAAFEEASDGICNYAGVKAQKAAQSQGGSTDDRLYAFEAAGQLLGMDGLVASEQEAAVRGLLQPLQQQMDEQLKIAGKASAGSLSTMAAEMSSSSSGCRSAVGCLTEPTPEWRIP